MTPKMGPKKRIKFEEIKIKSFGIHNTHTLEDSLIRTLKHRGLPLRPLKCFSDPLSLSSQVLILPVHLFSVVIELCTE